ncbi:MAG: hypothetical protein LBP92_11305 [Deltaproteobacteria bacterium]|jgi:hypothetical protein|nr:hypothetical protein [Deltaproteobacteria bacterium]
MLMSIQMEALLRPAMRWGMKTLIAQAKEELKGDVMLSDAVETTVLFALDICEQVINERMEGND